VRFDRQQNILEISIFASEFTFSIKNMVISYDSQYLPLNLKEFEYSCYCRGGDWIYVP
jgi:hypothetical protein